MNCPAAYGEPVEGTPFGRYRLIELLGRGGMGEVWRAYDPTMDRMVALKVLPENFAGDEVFKERFRREARAASGLDEPHVVPFHDFGEIDGRLYVTMRLIKGRDLQTVLTDGPLAPERAVRIIEQVAKALHAAHRIGLIHRDVKPSNILIAEDDFAYLIDFGIAHAAGETGLTSTGAAIGTWAYMSPERLNTGHADARADIYALTCVLHEALTGQRPYPGDSLEQQIVGHLTTPPPRPSAVQPGVPQPLDAVIAKGMAKNPDQRYATTVELARAARDATTVPLPRPGPTAPVYPHPAGPIHSRYTEPGAAGAAPVLPPPPGPPRREPPPQPLPTPKRPMWQRPNVVIPAIVAIVMLIAAGVFAAVKVSQHDKPTGMRPERSSVASSVPEQPLVMAAQLPKLLLSIDEVKHAVNAPNLAKVDDAAALIDIQGYTVTPSECLSALFASTKQAYEHSPVRGRFSRAITGEGQDGMVVLDETMSTFDNMSAATSLVSRLVGVWRGCAGKAVTMTGQGNTITFDVGQPVANGAVTTLRNSERGGLPGYSVDRAIVAKANVVIDLDAQGFAMGDALKTLADQILARVPS
jgi:predicted Ser/Thr protein kinase